MVERSSGTGDSSMSANLESFEVGESWYGRVVVLSVVGDVDMLSAPRLTASILTAVANKPAGVIIDLTKVEFLASSGMSVLIAAHEQVTPSVQFGVVAAGPATSRPMKLMGVDATLALYPTLDAALSDLR